MGCSCCLCFLWLLVAFCCAIYQAALTEAGYHLRQLPGRALDGFYYDLGFAHLQRDILFVQVAAQESLGLCEVAVSAGACSILKVSGNRMSNTSAQKRRILLAFGEGEGAHRQGSLRGIEQAKCLWTGAIQSAVSKLHNIYDNISSMQETLLPCATAARSYCFIYSDASALLSTYRDVRADIERLANDSAIRIFKKYGEHLIYAHVAPYVLLCFMLVVTFQRVDGSNGDRCSLRACMILLWIFLLAIATVSCVSAWFLRMELKQVKFHGHVAPVVIEFPPFWRHVFAEANMRLLLFQGAACAFEACCVLVVFYGRCLHCLVHHSRWNGQTVQGEHVRDPLIGVELGEVEVRHSINNEVCHSTNSEPLETEMAELKAQTAELSAKLLQIQKREMTLDRQLRITREVRLARKMLDLRASVQQPTEAGESVQQSTTTGALPDRVDRVACAREAFQTHPAERGRRLLDDHESKKAARRPDSAPARLRQPLIRKSRCFSNMSPENFYDWRKPRGTVAGVRRISWQDTTPSAATIPIASSTCSSSVTLQSGSTKLVDRHVSFSSVREVKALGRAETAPSRYTPDTARQSADLTGLEASVQADVPGAEPWATFLTRATERLEQAGVSLEPGALFETFRASDDIGMIYASFAQLFHLATSLSPNLQSGRRTSKNALLPPWVSGIHGCAYSYPYEPMRVLLGGSWKAKRLWKLLDDRCSRDEYSGRPRCGEGSRLEASRCLVVGAGPCGLRAAIEMRLLGARVTVVDQRESFSRINQLHLWSWCGDELKQLGARCLEPPPNDFAANPDKLTISISDLQKLLLKVALLLGVEVLLGVRYTRSEWAGDAWHSRVEPCTFVANPVSPRAPPMIPYVGVLLCAGGLGCAIGEDAGMTMIETDHLKVESALGLVCNFARTGGANEVKLRSFSLARQFYEGLFRQAESDTGAELENIVYVKGHLSHYFVMTPSKKCLCESGVVRDRDQPVLSPGNIDKANLDAFVRRVVAFPFKQSEPAVHDAISKDTPGKVPAYADTGPMLFDFSKMRRSQEGLLFVDPPPQDETDFGSEAVATSFTGMKCAKGSFTLSSPTVVMNSTADDDDEDDEDDDDEDEEKHYLLVANVGDALIEPFWPEGLGISRGFFGVLDVCAAVAEWSQGIPSEQVMVFFQTLYTQLKSLSAATRANVLREDGSQDQDGGFRLDPKTRYRRIFQRRNTLHSPTGALRRRSTTAFVSVAPEEIEATRSTARKITVHGL